MTVKATVGSTRWLREGADLGLRAGEHNISVNLLTKLEDALYLLHIEYTSIFVRSMKDLT